MIDETAPVHVTAHAVERYRERIAPHLSWEDARDQILASAQAIRLANTFGCSFVRTGSGARLVLIGARVVTVLGKRQRPPCLLDKVGGSDE